VAALIIVAYYVLTTHANMGNGTKLDEARQRQKDRVIASYPFVIVCVLRFDVPS
jgi:hypothetical protein